MNKRLVFGMVSLASLVCTVASAQSSVGGSNMQLDSTSCYSWGGSTNTNSWSRCDTVKAVEKVAVAAPAPEPIKVVPLPAPLPVEKRIRQ